MTFIRNIIGQSLDNRFNGTPHQVGGIVTSALVSPLMLVVGYPLHSSTLDIVARSFSFGSGARITFAQSYRSAYDWVYALTPFALNLVATSYCVTRNFGVGADPYGWNLLDYGGHLSAGLIVGRVAEKYIDPLLDRGIQRLDRWLQARQARQAQQNQPPQTQQAQPNP